LKCIENNRKFNSPVEGFSLAARNRMKSTVDRPTTLHVVDGSNEFITNAMNFDKLHQCSLTSTSAIAERPRDARVTSIRKIAKWNF